METTVKLVVLCACLCVIAQAKEVTLTVHDGGQSGQGGPAVLSDEVSIGTNEVAEVTSSYGPDYTGPYGLIVIKNGITNSVAAYTSKGVRVAGPATLRLMITSSSGGTWFCSVKILPESFPPGQTIILPQGTVGVIHVESSTNLIQWQDEWVQTFANTNQNRFFRLRAERSLP